MSYQTSCSGVIPSAAAPALTREAQDWLDRVDEIGSCWASVADLLAGDEPDTAKLAALLGFLSREYTAARDGLHAALLADMSLADTPGTVSLVDIETR